MAVDVHVAVIGHGKAVLEPQLDRIHVKLALFEVGDLLHTRRILARVGIPEGNGHRLPGFHIELHFLPALVSDLVLVGIDGGDRRGRTRGLARCVIGLHVFDGQVLEALVLGRSERDLADATRVLGGVGHAAGHNSVVCRRGTGAVKGVVLVSGGRLVCRCRRRILLILLRFCRGRCRRSRVGHRSRRIRRCQYRSRRIPCNRRRHRSCSDLARRSGGIGTFGRKCHTRQQQLTSHQCACTGASNFGTHTTPSTVNQWAGTLTLGLRIKMASVHNDLLGRGATPPQRRLSPLRRSCTTKLRQTIPHA